MEKERTSEIKEDAKESLMESKEITKKCRDKTHDGLKSTLEKTKEEGTNVAEAMQNIGEKIMGAFGMADDTTKEINR